MPTYSPRNQAGLRRRRPLLLLVGVLVVGLLVGATWVLPGMLDWNRYRDGIASLASQRLGRPVHIGGGVSLQLLPQPILTADDVSVEDAGDGIGLRARALRLRVALGPLLAGRLDARELVLQGGDLRLPWPPSPGALGQRPPPWVTELRARVEDSRLQVGDLVLAGVDATVASDPETGALSAAGVGEIGTRVWQFTARLGRPGGDGTAGFDVSLDGQGPLRDTGGTFSGQIGADGALSGRVAGRGPDLSLLMPAPALPWRSDGRLSAAGGLAVADELALEIGGAPARGSVALRVLPSARLDLSIAAGRLDLDAWLPALLLRAQGAAGLPTGIDLSAEAATLAGGTLRGLRGAVDLGAGGAVVLRDVVATLPGEARLALSGQVSEGPARFDGMVRLAAPDLRTTLRWLQRLWPAGLDAVPAEVLRTAEASAHVVAALGAGLGAGPGRGPVELAVSDLRGTLDGARLSGAVAVRLADAASGARPMVTAGVTLERAALDLWVPAPAGGWSLDRALGKGGAVLAALRGVDGDVRLQVQQASWGAAPLGSVVLEVQTDAARLFVRRLEAQPYGVRLAASGQVVDGGRLVDGRLEATAADAGVVRTALAGALGPAGLDALLRGPASLVMQVAGPAEALTGRVTLELSDLRVEAQPTVNLAARRASGALTLHHPGAPRLLETLGLGGTAAWLGDGSLSLVGQAAATPGRLELIGATLSAGALRVSGGVVLEGRRLTGQVAAETLPLPLVYPRSPEPLPVAALRRWEAAVRVEAAQVLVGLTPVLTAGAADVSGGGGVLWLDPGAGRVSGGTLVGNAMVDASVDPPRATVQATAAGIGIADGVFGTPLDVFAGQMEGSAELSAAGYSPAALLATLEGRAGLRVRDGVAVGFDLPAAGVATGPVRDRMETARAALLAGNSPFGMIEGTLVAGRGIVTADLGLTSLGGTARLTGSFDLLGGTLDTRLVLRPAPDDGPALGLRVTGPAGQPTRTPELAELARWLAERPGP